LGEHGHWVWMQPHGWVWYPSYVDHGWRPYTSGHWVWSDYGWYWVSDEPWGWATYHYGRWVADPYYGWVWVPGTEWGPSWVAWRESTEYIGWAPLPPRCVMGVGGRFAFEESWIQPDWYVFVGYGHFCSPISHRTVIINKTIVYKTVNITKINHADTVIINQGPGVDRVRKVSADKVRVVNFAEQAKAHGGKLDRVVPPQIQAFREGRHYDAPHRGKPEVATRMETPVTPKSTEKVGEKHEKNANTENRTRQQESYDRIREKIEQSQNRKQDREKATPRMETPVAPRTNEKTVEKRENTAPRVVPRQNFESPAQPVIRERYVPPTNDRQVEKQQRTQQYQRDVQERYRASQERSQSRQSQPSGDSSGKEDKHGKSRGNSSGN